MRETRGTETRTLPVRLTDDELIQRGGALARALQAVRDEKARQKAQREQLKDALADLEGECARIGRIVRDRAEDRPVTCRVVCDFDTAIVQLVREDTGEVVESREMTDRERQIGLPMAAVQ